MQQPFRVGITKDFLNPDGTIGFGDIGLNVLDEADGIQRQFLDEDADELKLDQIRDFDALLVLGPKVTRDTVEANERLAIVARFGVGYDSIDVAACTENGVMLTITPDGVRRPVASSVMCLVLALGHKLLIKDRLIRGGRWAEKLDHMGMGLTGRVLGLVGLGNIGREILALAQPFSMKRIAADPLVSPQQTAGLDVELVDLATLMESADFVVICCALTKETHHLIDQRLLVRMKPTAYLVNVARGPVVDQQALTQVLEQGGIQGAGLDVFEQEPIAPDDPLLKLDNVILSPHAICWTDECFAGNGRSACQSIVDVARGREPQYIVNRDVLAHPKLKGKLQSRV